MVKGEYIIWLEKWYLRQDVMGGGTQKPATITYSKKKLKRNK